MVRPLFPVSRRLAAGVMACALLALVSVPAVAQTERMVLCEEFTSTT
ncbi:MAG: hypothetical protein KKB50_20820 [Planctomycetes bacterium]|nr:hypothetical protein [Planctomycetota bacterium]